jgi:hypothetical protein
MHRHSSSAPIQNNVKTNNHNSDNKHYSSSYPIDIPTIKKYKNTDIKKFPNFFFVGSIEDYIKEQESEECLLKLKQSLEMPEETSSLVVETFPTKEEVSPVRDTYCLFDFAPDTTLSSENVYNSEIDVTLIGNDNTSNS